MALAASWFRRWMPSIGVRVHDGAAALGAIHQGDVFHDSVVGLHLEAPPVGPERAAHAFREPVRDLVGLDAVVEGADAVAELVGHIENGHHLVGAVAVHVHDDLALERAGEGLEFEVALRRFLVVISEDS
jgi:hypothetical protein